MIFSIVSWMSEEQLHLLGVISVSILLFLFSVFNLRNRSIPSNRSVSVGRDNYGVINTGDSNRQEKTSLLSIIANIATILAFLVSLFGAYLSYLAVS